MLVFFLFVSFEQFVTKYELNPLCIHSEIVGFRCCFLLEESLPGECADNLGPHESINLECYEVLCLFLMYLRSSPFLSF